MYSSIFIRDFQSIIDVSRERLRRFAGETILITGAGGFIGSYLMDFFAYCNDFLFAEKCDVIGEDNFSVGSRDRLKYLEGRKDIELLPRDISEWPTRRGLPRIDWIINCASIASPAVYRTKPLHTMRVNSIGTWNALQLASEKGIKGFLQMSSSEVYGDAIIVPTPEYYVGEIQPLGPRSCYDISKLFGETLCYLYHKEHGVPVKIARPFNVYGVGHGNDGRIIPALMAAVVEDKEFVVHGSGAATRSYCYVSDAVVQLLAVLVDGAPGEAYNVGNDDMDISVVHIVELAQELFDGKPKMTIDYTPILTQDQPSRRMPNIEKVTNLCGKRPSVTLREGLIRVYESMNQ